MLVQATAQPLVLPTTRQYPRLRKISCYVCTKYCCVCGAAWRNGIASDYESGDCRFDPCGGHSIFFLVLLCQTSLYECSLLFLITFVCDILEALCNSWNVRGHLPEVAHTYTRVIHRQRNGRFIIGVVSLRRGEVSRH